MHDFFPFMQKRIMKSYVFLFYYRLLEESIVDLNLSIYLIEIKLYIFVEEKKNEKIKIF